MKIKRLSHMYQITANNGEVAFLWITMGRLHLYNTKVEVYRDQLRVAKTTYSHYVRNCEGKRIAKYNIQVLERLIIEEEDNYEYRNGII
jgi:hypothetical protein